MDKDIILKKELKGFNINIDDIEPNDNILVALEEAIVRMRNEYLINRLEVVLNDNLIEVKDKITNCRTLFGARISYDNLPKDISFVIREDNKPTYEQLEQQVQKQKEVIDKINKYLNEYDVFKVFYFPLMKRWEEEQVKSSIDYEFKASLIKDLKDLLKEVSE